ncbi:protein strawberry notch-like [Contarinia nasturtii]|uniref:protein strawberry notch-like n=1 Tax=Contarinia nasturtii TaxID=265458 RepID=UPI0012D40BC6|nr:protein strawberry notch-like [Contarinia nasturtii]
MSKNSRKRKHGGPNGLQLGVGIQLGSGSTAGTNPPLDEVDEEGMVVAETYAEYWPAKLKIGKKHPDAVVETASLSSVAPTDISYELEIPDETIDEGKLSALQLESIIYASQAHEQLLPNNFRAGFLIGDGAGVGKGRTVAGIIFESHQRGRKKAIWISVSADLVEDSTRDLKDIGAGKIKVHNLSKFKYGKIDSKINGYINEGVIFSTYSSLISKQAKNKNISRLNQLVQWFGADYDGVIIFDECHKAKHLVNAKGDSSQTGKAVEELQERLPNARVVYASATGASEPRNMAYMNRLGLWGDGTPFRNFALFLTTIEKRGVGAMEVVAMDMKLRGMYIARQLSFKGVTFKIEEIPFDEASERTYNDSVALWIEASKNIVEAIALMKVDRKQSKVIWAQFWGAHQRFFKYLCIASKIKFAVKAAQDAVKDGKCVVIGLQSTGEARTLEELDIQGGQLNNFVSTAKAVFHSMIRKHFPAPNKPIQKEKKTIAKKESKVIAPKATSKPARKRSAGPSHASTRTKRPRFTITVHDSDTETSSDSDCDIEINEWDSSSSDESIVTVASNSSDTTVILNHSNHSDFDDDFDDEDFKIVDLQKTDSDLNNNSQSDRGDNEKMKLNAEQAARMKADLLNKIEKLGERLPTNTLDNLIDLLGGTSKVAELTGRKGRVVRTRKGVEYESRAEDDVSLEKLNIREKERFMNGEKLIAIISEAASNGISLQSDRRVKNKRRRVHITLELPWSADRAIQQFGRTHRANQVSPPEYIFLISDLAGERRFAASVAKRLESLGALTHADRRATDTRDLSQFNVENRYGKNALGTVYDSILRRGRNDSIPPPKEYKGDFFEDLSNALIGVGLMEDIEGLTNKQRLKDGARSDIARFLNRILGLPVKLQNHLFKYFTDTMDKLIDDAKKAGKYDMGIMDMGNTNNVKVLSTRTFNRKHATGIAPIELHTIEIDRGITFEEAEKKYAKSNDQNEGFYISKIGSRKTATLAMFANSSQHSTLMQIYRPNVGILTRQEYLTDILSKNYKVAPKDAKKSWNDQYEASQKMCAHKYWWGNCKNAAAGFFCDFGLRKREYYVVAGSIFAVWQRIEHQINQHEQGMVGKLQVIRMKTAEGRKIVGVLVPQSSVTHIIEDLEKDSVQLDN